jgi:hypothetical protein
MAQSPPIERRSRFPPSGIPGHAAVAALKWKATPSFAHVANAENHIAGSCPRRAGFLMTAPVYADAASLALLKAGSWVNGRAGRVANVQYDDIIAYGFVENHVRIPAHR